MSRIRALDAASFKNVVSLIACFYKLADLAKMVNVFSTARTLHYSIGDFYLPIDRLICRPVGINLILEKNKQPNLMFFRLTHKMQHGCEKKLSFAETN
jgi:hypothetical protein